MCVCACMCVCVCVCVYVCVCVLVGARVCFAPLLLEFSFSSFLGV